MKVRNRRKFPPHLCDDHVTSKAMISGGQVPSIADQKPASTINHQSDSHLNELLNNLDIVRLSRPPPKRPEFLFNVPFQPPKSTMLDSVPKQCPFPEAEDHSLPKDDNSFLSVTTVTGFQDQAINANYIIKPSDWKLMPPSAFSQISKN